MECVADSIWKLVAILGLIRAVTIASTIKLTKLEFYSALCKIHYCGPGSRT